MQINQKALKLFYESYPRSTPESLKAVDQVITIVLIKHFSAYFNNYDELRSQAYLSICENAQRYDPSYSAYNYCYTTARDAIGNFVKKYTKETFIEDYRPYETGVPTNFIELPTALRKFQDYITGAKSFTLIPLTPSENVALRFFFLSHQNSRALAIPSFLQGPRALEFLYRIATDK